MPADPGGEISEQVIELVGHHSKVVCKPCLLSINLIEDDDKRLPLIHAGNAQHGDEDPGSDQHTDARPELHSASFRLLELRNHHNRRDGNPQKLPLDVDDRLVDLAHKIETGRLHVVADLAFAALHAGKEGVQGA